jgi:hypothetical protein
VSKPQVISASGISEKLKGWWEAKVDPNIRLVDIPEPKWLKSVNV